MRIMASATSACAAGFVAAGGAVSAIVEQSLGTGRHAGGVADPFNGRIDASRISHIQRSDCWRSPRTT
jgi:hypothetical protein